MTEILSKRRLRLLVKDFVLARKAAGDDPGMIADAVNKQWPQAEMTPRGAQKVGWENKIAWDGDGRPPRRTDGPCQYKSVVGGKLHVCGEPGYPYCANHVTKTTPLPNPRYGKATRAV